MIGITLELYPAQIREARYGGAYEGGSWIMICGVDNYANHTDAIASDIPCQMFWERADEDGPIIDIIDPHGTAGDTSEIYAASGDRPGDLWDEFIEFVSENDRYQDREWERIWD